MGRSDVIHCVSLAQNLSPAYSMAWKAFVISNNAAFVPRFPK